MPIEVESYTFAEVFYPVGLQVLMDANKAIAGMVLPHGIARFWPNLKADVSTKIL